MTTETESAKHSDHIVVVFDIVSSSGVVEELDLEQDLSSFRNLLIAIKNFLKKNESRHKFRIYKFTGDGWTLLFDREVEGKRFFVFLTRLSWFFREEFSRRLAKRLDVKPGSVGLTFGIAMGRLLKVKMLGINEYIGRPLIIASRLQGAIRDKDQRPEYKALMTRRVSLHLSPGPIYKPQNVTRTLRNIRGGAPFQCVKIRFPVES